jgi:hypothetical protein
MSVAGEDHTPPVKALLDVTATVDSILWIVYHRPIRFDTYLPP